jgi:RNA polymerase sigma-70 factor (ECF subfamily)
MAAQQRRLARFVWRTSECPVAEKADNPSDQELVAAVNAGDWAAFDVLYHRYRDWTFRLAWRFGGDENDAQDVVQEVFVYLAGKFRVGLELRAGLTTLLYPAVKHTALALRHKRGRTAELADGMDVPARPAGATPDALRESLAGVLQGLSNAHREVLLMRFVDDLTLDEIATALAIPVGTVKSRLHHAIAGLREDEHLRKYF